MSKVSNLVVSGDELAFEVLHRRRCASATIVRSVMPFSLAAWSQNCSVVIASTAFSATIHLLVGQWRIWRKQVVLHGGVPHNNGW